MKTLSKKNNQPLTQTTQTPLRPIFSELSKLNSSANFWRALDKNAAHANCSHHHNEDEAHLHLNGNFLIAQTAIEQAIKKANLFQADIDEMLTVFLLSKAQDQIGVDENFESQLTKNIKEEFGISESLDGIKITKGVSTPENSETQKNEQSFQIKDAKEFLCDKFKLKNFNIQASEIFKSSENNSKKARQILNLGFENFVNSPLTNFAKIAQKNTPPLWFGILLLGVVQLAMRSANDQKNADALRNNIGAASEVAAFFVLVNGILENLSHSFVLAAPAFVATVIFDKTRHFCTKNSKDAQTELATTQGDIESQPEIEAANPTNAPKGNTAKKKGKTDREKQTSALENAIKFLQEEPLWQGLKKFQLAYQDNKIAEILPQKLEELLENLPKDLKQSDKLILEKSQDLKDSLHLLQTYQKVYSANKSAGKINQTIEEFCNAFAKNGWLLEEPSKQAQSAAFYCLFHHRLTGVGDYISQSLPHLPSGEQVALASLVIGTIFGAGAIYEAATGAKENYSSYVVDFPDHLFSWLALDQMYKNLGGNTEVAKFFKNFFGGFNLVENSTHLGIAVAPLVAYAQLGSKMFENLHHNPANVAAYLLDKASDYSLKPVNEFLQRKFTCPSTTTNTNGFSKLNNSETTNSETMNPLQTR